jgi:glycosyltransferase involved in cell wall biosynthesis
MRVLIVTDAWRPQINGVVRTLDKLGEALRERDVEVLFLTPEGYPSLPLPSYPEIRLALASARQIAQRIDDAAPDSIHIATEGPLGYLARRACLAGGRAFTTSYHTRFPEFLSARTAVPESWSYRWMRRFHNAGQGTLVATPSLGTELAAKGFTNLRPWTRGVDTDLFNPGRKDSLGLPRPIFLSVGRVAIEKNLPAFLDLDLPGSKIVVGDGPDLTRLKTRYPDVHFLGTCVGEELARMYASSDVFVFPSRTDTFGNVLLEALASGCPVAAFPVTGPLDIVGEGGGVLSNDLRQAALAALDVTRDAARAKALTYSWAECASQFLGHLRPAARKAAA